MQKREITVKEVEDALNEYEDIEEPIVVKRKNKSDVVIISLEEYKKTILDNEDYIEKALDEADRLAEDPNTKYLTHNEVFGKIRRKIDEGKI